MKLTNLFENTADHQQIKVWLDEMMIRNYTINDNSIVDVEGDVYINYRKLTSIPVQFGYVSGTFDCGSNYLTSLKGCPREVGGDFRCDDNLLTDLQGGPREVGGYFNCRNNKLTSLTSGPREVGGSFNCMDNNFKASPDRSRIDIGGLFWA